MTLSTNFQGKYLHLSTQTVCIKFQNYFIKKQYLIECLHDFQMDKMYLCTQILLKKNWRLFPKKVIFYYIKQNNISLTLIIKVFLLLEPNHRRGQTLDYM